MRWSDTNGLDNMDKGGVGMDDIWTRYTHYTVAAKIVETKDEACIEAVQEWAIENDVNEVVIMSAEKLKKVLELGLNEYQRLYGD